MPLSRAAPRISQVTTAVTDRAPQAAPRRFEDISVIRAPPRARRAGVALPLATLRAALRAPRSRASSRASIPRLSRHFRPPLPRAFLARSPSRARAVHARIASRARRLARDAHGRTRWRPSRSPPPRRVTRPSRPAPTPARASPARAAAAPRSPLVRSSAPPAEPSLASLAPCPWTARRCTRRMWITAGTCACSWTARARRSGRSGSPPASSPASRRTRSSWSATGASVPSRL